MRALPGVEFDAAWRAAAQTGAATSRPTGASTSPGPPGTVGVCSSACARRRWRTSPTAAAGSPPPRAFGEGPAVRNPLSLVPAIIARPRAFGESTIRHDMPPGLVEGIDRMDSAGRRRTLRSIGRASESSGFEAACEAALRVVEGGRVPDDAAVDVLARRIGGGGGTGGADLSVYDEFLKGAVADGS